MFYITIDNLYAITGSKPLQHLDLFKINNKIYK